MWTSRFELLPNCRCLDELSEVVVRILRNEIAAKREIS